MEQVQLKLSPEGGEAGQLVALIEAGNLAGALALNTQMASEMPFMPVDGWFVRRIEEKWGPGARATAQEAWARAQADAEEWQRDIRGMWDADCVAVQGRERLAALSERLAGARPKLEESRAKVEALDAQLEAVKPEGVAAEPRVIPFPKEAAPPKELALPGVAGEIQDYYLRSSMQPSQAMSIAVGLMVPTVLVSGNVIGPSGPWGCALHQTVAVIAPPSGGKQFGIDTTKRCLEEAGAIHLIVGLSVATWNSRKRSCTNPTSSSNLGWTKRKRNARWITLS
jgi:hypothetical protein